MRRYEVVHTYGYLNNGRMLLFADLKTMVYDGLIHGLDFE